MAETGSSSRSGAYTEPHKCSGCGRAFLGQSKLERRNGYLPPLPARQLVATTVRRGHVWAPFSLNDTAPEVCLTTLGL
jgi:hypothetical protein